MHSATCHTHKPLHKLNNVLLEFTVSLWKESRGKGRKRDTEFISLMENCAFFILLIDEEHVWKFIVHIKFEYSQCKLTKWKHNPSCWVRHGDCHLACWKESFKISLLKKKKSSMVFKSWHVISKLFKLNDINLLRTMSIYNPDILSVCCWSDFDLI